jgi:hypothetical protein
LDLGVSILWANRVSFRDHENLVAVEALDVVDAIEEEPASAPISSGWMGTSDTA